MPWNTRSQAVARIARTYCLTAPLGFTWRRRSRDHLILHVILVVLWNGVSSYLQPFSRYCALSVLGSRVWPFRVTWRHRSRDHLRSHRRFRIGGPLGRSLLIQPFSRYCVLSVLESRVSLTFQGHVTSSVTWPFDSPYAISYWWSFGTKPLPLTVSKIFNVKCNAIVDVTLIWPLNKSQGHSFLVPIDLSYTTLYIRCQ